MDDDNEYEKLPTSSVLTNMSAGAMAGVLEHCVMYPVDTVKTRMQSLSPVTSGYNISSTFLNMVRNEGFFRPIRGVGAVIAGAGPAHALYFGIYELSKENLAKYTTHNHFNYVASASLATIVHDAISNPTEVIKQRLQMYNSPYKSVFGCMVGVYRTEGIRAFYRSYSTTLIMNLPHQIVHFSMYEFIQNLLNNERRYNPLVHVIAGGAAGACASALTTPLDVVKTLLNTQETGFIRNLPEALKQIYKVAGPLGFFKGISARVLYSMPATAICWSTYEFFKFYLCGVSRDEYKSSMTGKNSSPYTKDTSSTSSPSSVIVADAKLLSSSSIATSEAGLRYVLPTGSVVSAALEANEAEITVHTSPPSAPTTSPASTPPSSPAASPIKTVCELSSSVTTPTLSLHTRHTDVKSPFDRGF